MNTTTLEVGHNYLVEIELIDPWTNEPYIHECLAEVIDWFAGAPHFYFDDSYGLESFIKINSEQIICFEGREVVVVNSEFGKRLCLQKPGGSALSPWVAIA